MSKRHLGREIIEGIRDIKAHKAGKIALRVGILKVIVPPRVSNLVGLATEPTEIFEFFLIKLSVLCGEDAISPPFWTLPVPPKFARRKKHK